jgi:hypothetical protein
MGVVRSNCPDLTWNNPGLRRGLDHLLLELVPKLVFRLKAHPWAALGINNQFDKEKTHQH